MGPAKETKFSYDELVWEMGKITRCKFVLFGRENLAQKFLITLT